jgi:hypothetical protein
MKAKPQLLGSETLNNGRDRADIVRAAGPDGTVAVYAINRTQRMADRLHDRGLIDGRQYSAATQLRDLWEQADLGVADLSAGSLQRISGGEREWVGDEAAFRRYTLAMRQMGRDGRLILFDVVVTDHAPDAWGRKYRCDGTLMLRGQLDRLAAWWSL